LIPWLKPGAIQTFNAVAGVFTNNLSCSDYVFLVENTSKGSLTTSFKTEI